MDSHLEVVMDSNGDPLAHIVRANLMPLATEFLTPDTYSLQIGMIVYGAGKSIVPHMHLPVVREVHGTSEVVIVRRGLCVVDIYDGNRLLVASRQLQVGDVILLVAGGHGFHMLEDTVLFEVKQGPYVDGRDKERFQ